MRKIYSSLKFTRFPEHLDALRSGKVVAPVHIRIKPMNYCNHDCWYCAYRVSNLELGEDIDYRDKIPDTKMFEIVDDIITMGVKAVTFSGGGEPLLYKPLPAVVERLATQGVKVATLTNGSNLKGRVADAFAEYGSWVRISLDAWDDESYAKSRGIKMGSFSDLINNIRKFSERKSKCVLGTSLIVDETNCSHIFEICALLKQAGVSHVKLSAVVVSNDGKANNHYHSKIKQIVREQTALAQKLTDEYFSIIDHYHDMDLRFDKHYKFCPQLMFLTVIGADCNVYTCQDKAFTATGKLGSISETSFREFWFSKENQKRLYGLDPSKDCAHHCVSHQKNLSMNEILNIDPEHGPFV